MQGMNNGSLAALSAEAARAVAEQRNALAPFLLPAPEALSAVPDCAPLGAIGDALRAELLRLAAEAARHASDALPLLSCVGAALAHVSAPAPDAAALQAGLPEQSNGARHHDAYFGISRTPAAAGMAYLHGVLRGLQVFAQEVQGTGEAADYACIALALTGLWQQALGAEPWQRQSQPDAPQQACVDGHAPMLHRSREPVRRWLLGHQVFAVLTQGLVVGVQGLEAALQPAQPEEDADPARIAAALHSITLLYRASTAAFRFAADFDPAVYTGTIRPSMCEPHVPPGFSGTMSADHGRLVAQLQALRPQLAAARAACPADFEAMTQALAELYDNHRWVCERFTGSAAPSLRSGHMNAEPAAVEMLERFKTRRLEMLSAQPRAQLGSQPSASNASSAETAPMSAKRIAVIGLSTRYAGGVESPDQLWANLKAGVDPISDFPAGRWDRGYLNADHSVKGRSYIYAGGYLDNVDGFDAEFFGISPREAQQIDPQQRLLLELAWEALEQAGIVPSRVAGTATGVFVGLSSRDYGDFHDDSGIDAYTNLGLSLSIASNRISYVLDLKGPSLTIDTACSSGMVALHQAMQSLQRGDCSMALVGAANLVLSPKAFIGFSKASMLSPAGRCTTFDADGAGYVRAEGGGVLLLKDLDAAERDGDRILGVIVASGVNSDGRTMGIALPSADAQAALLHKVYAEAGIAPDDVYYVEAHGTGTAVGDPIECEAIARVLGGDKRSTPLRVGSIKSNVGHLEPAAGIAGLTKVLLAMQHRELPANLHFKTPNPKIDFAGWKLDVVSTARPLPDSDKPLVFGVNSFGFGGTNAHAVLQEYRASAQQHARQQDLPAPVPAPATPWQDVLVLSGQSAAALQAVAAQWQALLQTEVATAAPAEAASRWEALRAAALHQRSHHSQRLALHAGNSEEALARLSEYLAAQSAAAAPATPGAANSSALEVVAGKAPAAGHAATAWVYAGNGPQWWGMGRELMAADATYRSAVEAVDAIFQRLAGWSLVDELMRDEQTSRMALTDVAQPTLFALQVGLTTVLRAAGLQPAAVFGHSVGEAAAAWASGALSLEQATHVIHQRSLAQSATAGMGRMAALGISEADAHAAISRAGGWLEVAAVNAPAAVTVAGDAQALAALCQSLVDAGKFARVLALDYPFHTQAMDGIRAGLLQGLAGLQPGVCTVPFVSTVEGRVIDGSALGAEYWWRNVREPVAFQAATVHALDMLKIGGLIEIGPHPVLRDYLLQNAKARSVQATVLTTLKRPRKGMEEPELGLLRQTVCAAYAAGLGDPTRLAPAPATRLPLPLYPWQRQRHWRGEHGLPDQRPATQRDHPLLGWRLSPTATVWENQADLSLLPYLADHAIQDSIVFPGAGYVEVALAAARRLHGDVPLQLEGVDFLKPMVLGAPAATLLQCRLDAADGSFEILSRTNHQTSGQNSSPDGQTIESTLHSRGRVTLAEPSHRPPRADIAELWDLLPEAVPAAVHYADSAARGLHYGPAFQSMRALRMTAIDDDERLAAAWIELPAACGDGVDAYRSHPALLDGCLQVLITLLGRNDAAGVSYIPVRVDRLRSFAPLPRRLFCEARLGRDSARSGSAQFVLRDEAGECVMVLDDTRFQKADLRAGRSALRLADRWRADPLAAVLATPAAPWAEALPEAADAAHSTGHVEPHGKAIDALAGAYAAGALRSLQAAAGLDAQQPFSAAGLLRRARVVPEQQPLARALLAMAQADGSLLSSDAGLQWAASTGPTAAEQWRALMLAAPGHAAELMLLAQAGERLLVLLRGEAEPALPLAAARAHPAFETLLDNAPYRAAAHRAAVVALRSLLARWPADRPLRVLELHAGAGGLTAAMLPELPHWCSDYAASDRDAAVVERLQQRFSSALPLRGLTIDLADVASLAPQQGRYDLLLCADGLAACGLQPETALQRARSLLVPGGCMLLLAPEPQRLATIVLGQDPAWWLDGSAPLRDSQAWQGLFQHSGWNVAAPAAAGRHSLWLATAGDAQTAFDSPAVEPAAAPTPPALRDWLLLLDTSPANQAFGEQLSQALLQRGQRVRSLNLHAAAAAQAMDLPANSLAADDAAGLAAALRPPLHAVVHLAGLLDTTSDPLAQQPLRCLPLIALSHTQQRDDSAALAKPRLMLVARGATMGPAANVNDALTSGMDPSQAPVWGLARVLSNEHADFRPKLVDLHGAADAAMAARLADELLNDDGETEVLLDATGRWLQRLQAHSAADFAADAASLPGGTVTPIDPRMGVRLQASAQGGLDALSLQPAPRRAPAAGEVELAVRAAGLNFRDVLWAMNMLPEEAVENGFSGATIGMECAGEVVAVGAGVDHLRVGDRVIGFASGCFASHVTTTAGAVDKIPADLAWEAAATLPTAFLTAQYALLHLARLEPGERVLIHGAAGGVGLAAVQIARLRGATVFGTAGNDEKRRLLRLYGVDHVLDSRSLAFADDVMALTGGQGVDVVLNSLAGEAITKNLQILRPFGRLLEIGKRDFYANSRIGLRPFRNNLSYFGIDADTLLIERADLARKVFAEVAALVATGALRPLPYQALPITRAAKAFRLMQQSRHVGKIVVTLPGAGQPQPQALPATWQADPNGTYLVTGGLGGFGLATARWMVAQGARHMALVSRRGASTEEAQTGIAAMRAAGASVRAYAADVSDAGALAGVLAELRASQPPLRGVLHAAMVLDDTPMLGLNQQRLMQVLAPKIAGAWQLHLQTLQDRLDCFVLYSSATTVVGNPGQGNYVAGNMYLQALAQWRRAQGMPALSIAWGAIKDVGVVTRTAGLAGLLEKRSGIGATHSDDALAELGRMMAAGAVAVSVAPFNVQRLAEMLPAAKVPRFMPLAPAGGVEASGAARETLAERWPHLAIDARRPLVVDVLRDHLARILGTAAAQVDIARPLSDMGLDSLMAVELATSLEREVGKPVSVMQMIQASSAAGVADTLLASLEPAAHG
jgi:acyl transferase domain-containing protein/NADPH:quinone reductase-like Zn-dependent oxidoreductase/acyl carrier protein